MGSERVEMGESTPTRTLEPDPTHTPTRTRDPPHTPANACCFCWCCCCSCSCLTVRSAKEEKTMTTISEEQEEADIEQMPQLTLEEVQSWAESFERLMKNPQGRLHFQQFLKSEFSEENLKFWLICENPELHFAPAARDDLCLCLQVSLDSRVRQVIHNKMQDPSSCTFDEAQLQIYTLMQRDSFPRFMNSSMYADLLQGLQTPSES